jgi:hypothetical protein
LIVAGLAAMVLAVVDPLEGGIVVVAGAALAALGVLLAGSRRPQLSYAAVGLAAAGVGAMWWMSALGGFGGNTGRSNWWALLLVPYPIGWIAGIAGAVRGLRDRSS